MALQIKFFGTFLQKRRQIHYFSFVINLSRLLGVASPISEHHTYIKFFIYIRHLPPFEDLPRILNPIFYLPTFSRRVPCGTWTTSPIPSTLAVGCGSNRPTSTERLDSTARLTCRRNRRPGNRRWIRRYLRGSPII